MVNAKIPVNRLEENKARYENMKNRTNKLVADAMRKEAEKEITKLNKKLNNIVTLMKFMMKYGKDIEGGKSMRGKDGKLNIVKKTAKEFDKVTWRKS